MFCGGMTREVSYDFVDYARSSNRGNFLFIYILPTLHYVFVSNKGGNNFYLCLTFLCKDIKVSLFIFIDLHCEHKF